MSSGITVQELRENEFDEWRTLVSSSPDGSVYSLPEYLDVLCRTAGGRFSLLGVRCGDELAGGIALYECTSRYGPYASPRRLLYYNGIVLRRYETKYPSEQTGRHLRTLGALVDALATRGYAWVTLNCRGSLTDVRPFLAAGWSATPQYTYVVPIGNLELLWSRIEQNLRRLIKRCERDGMIVIEDDDFDSFYRLHSATMDRKQQANYLAEDAFRRYFGELRRAKLCSLYHATLPNGRRIASQLVLLGPRPVSHSVAAASDEAYSRTGVNALLRWRVFTELSAMGFLANDLTDASLNAVTHFKSQLGGDLQLFLGLEGPRSWRYRLGHGGVALCRRAIQSVEAALRPHRARMTSQRRVGSAGSLVGEPVQGSGVGCVK